jgi:hypothetical protein
MFDLSDAVLEFATPYTVTRRTAGSFVNGRHQPGGTTTFEVKAAVMPLTGRDLMRLPEGMRTSEALAVYTTTRLQMSGQPDTIAIGDATYEVQEMEDWMQLGGFYRFTVAKVG